MAEESSTNAVLDQQGAEPTPGASLTPPEGSTAKDGETKPGETPPAKGKSSQDTLSPDDSLEDGPEPEKGKDVPHGQWLRMKDSRNKIRQQLQDLSELGINSKEDAEALLKEVEVSETEARKIGANGLRTWIENNPREFLTGLYKQNPAAYEQIVQNNVFTFITAIASTNKELAEQFKEAAVEFFGDARADSRKSPQGPDKAEAAGVQQEKQEWFDDQVDSDIRASLSSKLTELTKGLSFQNEKQKTRFFDNVVEGMSDALKLNPVFTRNLSRLSEVRSLSTGQLRGRRSEVAAFYLKHATDALLKRYIEEEKSTFGISVSQKQPNQDEKRREITGTGAPPNGKGLTKDAKDKAYAELSSQYTGPLLSEKWALWLGEAKNRA